MITVMVSAKIRVRDRIRYIVRVKARQNIVFVMLLCIILHNVCGIAVGVKTLRTQDTSDPEHFGTSAEVSIRHFGTSAELSGHFGTSAEMSWDTSALRKILRHCAIICKVDGKLGLYSIVIG